MSVTKFLKRFRHRIVPPSLPRGKKNVKKEKGHDEDEEDLDTHYDDDDNSNIFDDDNDDDDDESTSMGIDRVISWASILTGTVKQELDEELEEEEGDMPWSSHQEHGHELEQVCWTSSTVLFSFPLSANICGTTNRSKPSQKRRRRKRTRRSSRCGRGRRMRSGVGFERQGEGEGVGRGTGTAQTSYGGIRF